MIQEGHSKEVYALGCQDDGALIASGSVFIFFSRILESGGVKTDD